MVKTLLVCSVVLMLSSSAAFGVISVPSDGSDGAFNPTTPNYEVDLFQAVTATQKWEEYPGGQGVAGDGNGVYYPDKWAVVFKYSSVNIPSGVTVTFKNHPSRAPVAWLVQGNVTIAGTVNLDGKSGQGGTGSLQMAEPGPGGFRGGATGGNLPVGGLGPGGGGSDGRGSYGSVGTAGGPTYGNAGLTPLIGGSGGAGRPGVGTGGSAGGGAILIAAGNSVTVAGGIRANSWGDSYYTMAGSGGAIRIVADTLLGSGSLSAVGQDYGGDGRIRVEANATEFLLQSNPAYTYAKPWTDAVIWPDSSAPCVKLVSLGGQTVPGEPTADLTLQHTDLYFNAPGTQTLDIQANNVPLNWRVRARIDGISLSWVDAAFVSGDATSSLWRANISMPNHYSVIQVRTSAP